MFGSGWQGIHAAAGAVNKNGMPEDSRKKEKDGWDGIQSEDKI